MSLFGWIGLGLDALDSALGASSAHKANRMNLKLQREQQAWSKDMANTAVQRRKADITAAGGNPALAFTGGQEAATPSVAPARMEPEWKPGNAGRALALVQARNIQANTALQLAQAKKAAVEARITETTEHSETAKRVNRNVEEYEWDDLKTKILRATETSTAAQARQASQTVDDLIRQVKQQVASGKLELDQLERISNLKGLTPKDVVQIILHFMKD